MLNQGQGGAPIHLPNLIKTQISCDFQVEVKVRPENKISNSNLGRVRAGLKSLGVIMQC